ncbi:hypothetical protein, partial [Comamonas odontotermitis]|uniref:hypothetical protein n=1 Tax=Comamonas odontotermitis TaxID=379895 RepID=UPI001C886F67
AHAYRLLIFKDLSNTTSKHLSISPALLDQLAAISEALHCSTGFCNFIKLQTNSSAPQLVANTKKQTLRTALFRVWQLRKALCCRWIVLYRVSTMHG